MTTENRNTGTPEATNQEIDLIELLRKLWLHKGLILKITAGFMVVGLLLGLFGAKSYTASCQIVPQTNRDMSTSSMARLASLAGINMGNLTSGAQLISPIVYPNVISSVAYQRELLQTPINVRQEAEPVTLLTYLSDKKYQRFSLMGTVMKYTIGLPGLILRAVKGETQEMQQTAGLPEDQDIIVLTREERQAVGQLKRILSMKVEEKKGYIVIMVQFPEAYASAQIAESALKLLQRYITEFKIEKAQSNLDFIQERYDELKKEYEEVQLMRARYKDANLHTSTSRARTELERLDNQYSLAYSIYSEIATQLEQAKIQVKENTPVLTVIDPVAMPAKPTKPRRMLLLAGFTFLGLVAGCGYVLCKPLFDSLSGKQRGKGSHRIPPQSES